MEQDGAGVILSGLFGMREFGIPGSEAGLCRADSWRVTEFGVKDGVGSWQGCVEQIPGERWSLGSVGTEQDRVEQNPGE